MYLTVYFNFIFEFYLNVLSRIVNTFSLSCNKVVVTVQFAPNMHVCTWIIRSLHDRTYICHIRTRKMHVICTSSQSVQHLCFLRLREFVAVYRRATLCADYEVVPAHMTRCKNM